MGDSCLPPVPEHCTLAIRRRLKFGVATAAYQIEGAWDEGGRTPSIWDVLAHRPGAVADGDTGDVACDHYHKLPEDLQLMSDLGIKHYRFSFSWSRILPQGGEGTEVNLEGVGFYNRLIDGMIERGITPYATMYHWDLPQVLQEQYGGLLGGDAFVRDFVHYAGVLFDEFGDRVKNWMTFNEPWVICKLGYGDGAFAPGVPYGEEGQYKSAHALILAHARTAGLYNRRYRAVQGGRVGVVLNCCWMEPMTKGDADVAAARRALDQELGWFAGPLFKGDYPDVVKATHLVPEFSQDERDELAANRPDFLGINYYTANYVEADGTEYGYTQTPNGKDGEPIGPRGQSFWLFVCPWAFRKLLHYITDEYSPDDIMVTENGVSAPGEAGTAVEEAVRDAFRLDFYAGHLDWMCKAVEDGVKVSTYFAWSLMDNFEWLMGYTERFGITAVNFRDPSRTRTVKDSGRWLSENFFKVGAS